MTDESWTEFRPGEEVRCPSRFTRHANDRRAAPRPDSDRRAADRRPIPLDRQRTCNKRLHFETAGVLVRVRAVATTRIPDPPAFPAFCHGCQMPLEVQIVAVSNTTHQDGAA